MSQPKSTTAEEKAAHAHRDNKVDDASEDTFPASDPPPTTPCWHSKGGADRSRKSESWEIIIGLGRR
jgi:hypothetical protein